MLASAERDRILTNEEIKNPLRLERFGYKGFSQNDEDGILQEIFSRIGTTDRCFIEFGTGDGRENNTVFLLCCGWSGLWIDGSERDHQSQRNYFSWAIKKGLLKSVCRFLSTSNINEVIREAGLAGSIDLLSIDVDGNDYHLWKAIDVVQPRVVVIEYNAYAPPPVEWVMAYDPEYAWDGKSYYFSASLKSLELLGKTKGYTLVGCNLSGLNAFFVRSDIAAEKFVGNSTAEYLFHPRRWWMDCMFTTGCIPFDRPGIAQEFQASSRSKV